MPKATLTFKLPEEQEEFKMAQDGVLYSIVLEELDNFLRTKSKYENKTSIQIQEIRTKIAHLKDSRGLV